MSNRVAKKGGGHKRGKKTGTSKGARFSQRGSGGNFNHFKKPGAGSFYPHGKPPIYSYTRHFVDVGHDYNNMAETNTQYPGLGSPNRGEVLGKAINSLESLIATARAAETKFLADTGMDITKMDGGDVFRAINKILNSKQTFERGLAYMKQLANTTGGKDPEKEQMYRDVSRYFTFYLNKTIATKLINKTKDEILTMTPKRAENLINSVIGDALIESYKRVKDFVGKDGKTIRQKFGDKATNRDNEVEVRAIEDMINIIKDLKKDKVFGQFGYMFDLDKNDLNSLWQRRNSSKPYLKKTDYSDAKVDSRYGGSALELITTTVGAKLGNKNFSVGNGDLSLKIEGKHTGNWNEMKGDTILFVGHGDIHIPDYLDFVDRDIQGLRRQNIDAMGAYLNKLESNIEHVIVISDKNYSITADFDGIEAQSKMSLENAGAMLADFKVGQIDELINYLANCGAGMVHETVDAQIRTTLQNYIGYFLFDNLNVEVKGHDKPSVNVVNLLNVSGIYMPLSVYLEGILNSLKEISRLTPSSLVGVNISLGGRKHQRVWTEGTWTSFRKTHETQSFIEYRILRNIAKFISEL